MKHLKRLFENSDEEYLKHYGITPDDLRDFFVDLSDDGWDIIPRFMKKMYQFTDTQPMKDSDIKLGLIPYIQIEITKKTTSDAELKSLLNSEQFIDILDVVAHRLLDVGFYIKRSFIENKRLTILIYRKSDENYIK